MIYFPIVDEIVKAFEKWIGKPDNCDEVRWRFYKWILLVTAVLAVVVSAVLLYILRIDRFLFIVVCVFILLVLKVKGKYYKPDEREARKAWTQRWWMGQEKKWDILKWHRH